MLSNRRAYALEHSSANSAQYQAGSQTSAAKRGKKTKAVNFAAHAVYKIRVPGNWNEVEELCLLWIPLNTTHVQAS